MIRYLLAVLTLSFTGALPSQATTYRLSYSGNPFTLVYGPGDTPPDVFAGSITLAGAAFGNALAGKTLHFSAIDSSVDGPQLYGPDAAALLSWDMNIPLFSTAGTTVSFSFDAAGGVSDWTIDALDGPPDYYSGAGFDGFNVGDSGWRAAAGSWSISAIPLPAAAWLFIGALGALAASGRRRAQ